MKIIKILPFFFALAKATEPIRTVSCDRGADQASPNEAKYLVLPDFPAKYHGGPTKCIWTIQTSAGSRIQVKIPEIMSCQGGNHLILKEAGMTSKKICGKSPSQLIVSTTEELTFVLIVNKNSPRGMRVRIGFIQIGEPNGWTIDEFNKGKKAKALPKSPPKGKRPPPKLKSAGGPPKKSPPKKSPKKPKKPGYHSPVKKTGVTKSQIGDVQRWEKKDRRPILIGGGVVFLLLILAGAFFIGRAMKKDQEKQAELKATGANELPKFQIPELENPENFIKSSTEGENNEERNTTNLTREESADSGDGILKK